MRQAPALIPFLALMACGSPCPERPHVVNSTSLSDSELEWVEALTEEFLMATPSDGICIGEIRLEAPTTTQADYEKRAWKLRFDPTIPTSARDLTWALCHALLVDTDLLEEAPEHVFAGADGPRDFKRRCAQGPGATPYADQASVCPRPPRDAEQRFIDEEVYVDFRPPTAPGLAVMRQPEVLVEGVTGQVIVGSDGLISVDSSGGIYLTTVEGTSAIATVEFLEGESASTVAADRDWVSILPRTMLQPEYLEIIWVDRATGSARRAPLSEPIGDISMWPRALMLDGQLVISEWGDDRGESLTFVGLDGNIERVPIPKAEEPLKALVAGIFPVGGSLFAHLTDAHVVTDDDMTFITVYQEQLHRYDPVAEAWVAVRDLSDLYPFGVASDRILAHVYIGSDQRLLGQIDPTTGMLRVSGDVCLEEANLETMPFFAWSDSAWSYSLGESSTTLLQWTIGSD